MTVITFGFAVICFIGLVLALWVLAGIRLDVVRQRDDEEWRAR